VETFNLNKAIKRNIDRFPPEFISQLTKEESGFLRFQAGISKTEGLVLGTILTGNVTTNFPSRTYDIQPFRQSGYSEVASL